MLLILRLLASDDIFTNHKRTLQRVEGRVREDRFRAEDKPWKQRESMVADLDGNLIRVFYDFRDEI